MSYLILSSLGTVGLYHHAPLFIRLTCSHNLHRNQQDSVLNNQLVLVSACTYVEEIRELKQQELFMGKSVNVGGGFLVVLLCFLGCLQVGLAQSSANAKRIAISWDDMKMNKRGARVSSKYDFNGSRVIVVDKNGGADSLTVQGAIDLVPQYNTQRVKIYILPGIYRFAELLFFLSGTGNIEF